MSDEKRGHKVCLHSKEVSFARGNEFTSARSAMILASVYLAESINVYLEKGAFNTTP